MTNTQKINFAPKAVAGLIAVSVLVSIFIPVPIVKADDIACLSVSKLSRNVSVGTSWTDTTNAQPSQKVAFSIQVTATTNVTINTVSLNDNLPDKLTYISGSTKIDNVSASDDITGTGINIGSFTANQSKTITFEANLANSDSFPSGETVLTNTANAWAVCATLVSDTTQVVVNKETPSTPDLTITKSVRNITAGTGLSSLVSAVPGDEVEFSIEVRSTGTGAALNVRVWDNLPNRLEYISNSTRVDGVYKSDGLVGSGIYIGDLNSGQGKTIRFKAEVEHSNFYYNDILTNHAYTKGDNTSTVQDLAEIEVEQERDEPDLQIEKLVKNVSRGLGYYTNTVYSKPGDEIEFLIKVSSVGNSVARNVRAGDNLPAKLEYIAGSTTVDGYFKTDGIIAGSGIYIDDIQANGQKEIKFRAKVMESASFYASITTLTNEAFAWATDIERIKDYAYIKVEKNGDSERSDISIEKWVRNISKGQTAWFESVSADPSQEVEFSIQVSNIGNSNLTNVKVWDVLPAKLSIVSNTTTVDGADVGGDATGAGLDLGTLNKNVSKTIKFKAVLDNEDSFGTSSIDLTNTAYAKADNTDQVKDTARIGGQVKGAELPPTGASTTGLIFLVIISIFISLFVYCRTRETKLLDILNKEKSSKLIKGFIKFYFRIKFFVTVTKMRFKKVYW